MKPLLRNELIDILLDDKLHHPDDNWPVELRDRWIIKPPKGLQRCTIDRVLILRGEPAICLIHPDQRG